MVWQRIVSVISLFISDIERLNMIRTLISLDPEDKAWLDRKAKLERISVARLLRQAVQRLRQESLAKPSRFEVLLRETSGIGKTGDGLALQRRLRLEWDRRK